MQQKIEKNGCRHLCMGNPRSTLDWWSLWQIQRSFRQQHQVCWIYHLNIFIYHHFCLSLVVEFCETRSATMVVIQATHKLLQDQELQSLLFRRIIILTTRGAWFPTTTFITTYTMAFTTDSTMDIIILQSTERPMQCLQCLPLQVTLTKSTWLVTHLCTRLTCSTPVMPWFLCLFPMEVMSHRLPSLME